MPFDTEYFKTYLKIFWDPSPSPEIAIHSYLSCQCVFEKGERSYWKSLRLRKVSPQNNADHYNVAPFYLLTTKGWSCFTLKISISKGRPFAPYTVWTIFNYKNYQSAIPLIIRNNARATIIIQKNISLKCRRCVRCKWAPFWYRNL